MKNILVIVFITLFNQLFGQELTVMTYNIRLDVASDGENSWLNRKEKVSDLIQFYEPDVFGIQEGLPHQVQFLDSVLIDYNVFGKGRDGGTTGEHNSIFYNSNKLELIDFDTFWLSETPSNKSKGWDAALNRICTYGLFKHKRTMQLFWVFNTHFDHVGKVARSKSTQLIHQKILQLNANDYPVILMGDFNLEPNSEPLMFLSNHYLHSKSNSNLIYNAGGTFNAFEFYKPVSSEKEIDHIFVSKKAVEIKKYAVLTDSYLCRYPSDHFPVLVELKLLN